MLKSTALSIIPSIPAYLSKTGPNFKDVILDVGCLPAMHWPGQARQAGCWMLDAGCARNIEKVKAV